jgi:hypothetical protein
VKLKQEKLEQQKVDQVKRNKWVARQVVVELCRFLVNMKPGEDQGKAPVTVFLSHAAKHDLEAEPRAASKIIDRLKIDQPVYAWINSWQIPTGSKFSDVISAGVEESTALLTILTDNYSSREWCRDEVMPMVVIDTLSAQEVRSFPFLANVPRIRWNGDLDAQASIDLLLKETLRHLHTSKILKAAAQLENQIFLRPRYWVFSPVPSFCLPAHPWGIEKFSVWPLLL